MAAKEFGSISSKEFRNHMKEENRRYSKEELRTLSKRKLHEHMGHLSKREREHQAEVVASVCEVERRKLFFDFGFKNLFEYMTAGREFPNGSAQRYIDAARLCIVVPTLNEDIAKGDLNLSQVTIVAKTIRQKEKEEPKFQMEAPQTAALFEMIKGEDGKSSQQIIAQELKVEVKDRDLARVQANGSVRHETTFSKEQEEALQRVKELISHTHPDPSLNEVFEYLAQDWLKRNDPLIAEGRAKKIAQKLTDEKTSESNDGNSSEKINREAGFSADQSRSGDHYQVVVNEENSWPHGPMPAKRTYIPVHTVRFIHRRDRSCRWKYKETGEVCGSKFQVQPDHIIPLWAGGTNEPESLQLLCGVHNRLKYRRKAGIKWTH